MRWIGAASVLASVTWSALAVGAGAQTTSRRQEVARPAGWDAGTHAETVRPDYQRLFGTDTVHELRIVIAAEQFRVMQEDLRALTPSIPGLRGVGPGPLAGPGAAGAFGPGGRNGGFEQIAAFAEGVAAACSEKTADASCSVNGVDGKCTQLGPGPVLCLPAAVRDLMAEARGRGVGPGRGFAPGRGGALSMIARDPIYVPVTVQHDGREWTHVGMRYKGNSSLMMAGIGGNGKIPFRLDFDRYEDEFPEIRNQRFYGFQKLTFSSNFGDDSQIRELFVTEVFRDRGVPAPRAAFYRVFVDVGAGPEYWGLYTMIEDPADGAMLDAQFGGSSGNLYKPDGPGANWTEFAAEGFPKKTNEKQADFTDVETAIAALHAQPGPGSSAWRAGLEARFDVDLFLRWLAVNSAVQNWDAYGAMAHNYYLYGDPGQKGRLRWIPWDNNLALGAGFGGRGGFLPGAPPPGAAANGQNPPVPFQMPPMFGGGDDILHTRAGAQWPLISRLMADDVYGARYREHLAHALEGLLAPNAAVARMRQLHALIFDSVVGDRGELPGHTTISSRESFERSIDGPNGLLEIIERRHEAIRKALLARTN
ncbi:MAG TPA: CotH kinase family protein [Vicinamibacterales bacterium]|nr:CotH kinase family protein [Vicinamibacterales bacterium]